MKKIYHYEGFYKFFTTAEEVADEYSALPAHSTLIRPPFDKCPEDSIPVFKEGMWVIEKNDFWKPKTIELNFDAGRTSSTYNPLALSMHSHHFPQYPDMPMLCNGFLVISALIQKNRMVHRKFESIIKLHKEITKVGFFSSTPFDSPNFEGLATTPSEIFEYKLESESMIYLMRKILDSLVQMSYLITNYETFLETKVIQYNEIGKFLNKKNSPSDLDNILNGDNKTYLSGKTNFFQVINDLFNSFKHCLMHDETYSLFGIEYPTIVSYQAKENNHNREIIFHNHNAYHLIMGFQDNVIRILQNQSTYIELNKDRLSFLKRY